MDYIQTTGQERNKMSERQIIFNKFAINSVTQFFYIIKANT